MIDYARIKPSTMEALERYVNHHIPTGSFLEAVLSNDLKEAVGRADEDNYAALRDIVAYIYNELPANCWGSREFVKDWLKQRTEVSQ